MDTKYFFIKKFDFEKNGALPLLYLSCTFIRIPYEFYKHLPKRRSLQKTMQPQFYHREKMQKEELLELITNTNYKKNKKTLKSSVLFFL